MMKESSITLSKENIHLTEILNMMTRSNSDFTNESYDDGYSDGYYHDVYSDTYQDVYEDTYHDHYTD